MLKVKFYKGLIAWSFSNNSFERFHGKKIESQHDPVTVKPVL